MDLWELIAILCQKVVQEQNVFLDILITKDGWEFQLMPIGEYEDGGGRMRMNYAHTYCFYMTNGEHLMIDADDMTIRDDYIQLHREKDDDGIFMVVYKNNLLAWEVVR